MDSSNYLADLRKKAEEAVADMPEGDLKTKAFEVILQHLLTTRAAPPYAPATPKHGTSTKKVESSRIPGTVKSRVLLLKDEGFFSSPRTLAEVEHELKAHGWVHPQTALSGPLRELVPERHLRRIMDSAGKKKVWKYVNP